MEHLCLTLYFPWLSVGVCALHKAGNSPSIYQLASHSGKNFTSPSSQTIWGLLPVLSLHREKLAAVVFVYLVFADPGDGELWCLPVQTTISVPRYLHCTRSVRIFKLESQMPILWGSLEKLVYLMYTLTSFFTFQCDNY